MFNPKNLPSLREKYKNLLDISGIVLSSTERPVLYKSYFELVERIKLMGLFEAEVNVCIEDVKPFITHKNREIQLSRRMEMDFPHLFNSSTGRKFYS